jgi:hypothetical protein
MRPKSKHKFRQIYNEQGEKGHLVGIFTVAATPFNPAMPTVNKRGV